MKTALQKRPPLLAGAALALLALLTLWAYWETDGPGAQTARITWTARPRGVMGTTCLLAVRDLPQGEKKAHRALREAEKALRRVEALMSVHLADSEISRLDGAPPGKEVPLSPWTLQVLRRARELWKATEGAFDITCRPLLTLWKEGARRGRLPTRKEIQAARRASRWDLLVLGPSWAKKKAPGLQVDLGGIAKGFGIDKALEAMEKTGVAGGLVDVGGDLRVFGKGPGPEGTWKVEVRSPFGPSPLGSLDLRRGALCTSGGYFRYVEIQGRRFSHIVDPRTGRPADAAASVTVLGPDAASADAWATALAVLGKDGLPILEKERGLEALIVTGTRTSPETFLTAGMKALFRP